MPHLARLPRLLPVAAGLWLLLDLQRVWAPSLITIFGQAASTPAELMGLFALVVVASPALALVSMRRVAPTRRATAAAGLIIAALLARIALQFVGGGGPQLWIATAGLIAALAWLCLTPVGTTDLLAGALIGLAASTVTHAALGTWGAVWRSDPWAWGLVAVQAAGVLLILRDTSGARAVTPRLGVALLPALLLAGIALANVGRASAGMGEAGAALVAAASVVAAGIVLLRPQITLPSMVLVAVVLAVTTARVLGGADWLAPVSAAAGLLALAVVLLALAGEGSAEPEPAPVDLRGGWSLWAGGIGWVLLFFVYYAGYDLGYRADRVLIVLAVGLGLAAVLATRRDTELGGRGRGPVVPPRRAAVVGVALAGVVAGGIAWVGPQATVRPLTPLPAEQAPELRVLAWNLRMGYGMQGQFQIRQVAELIAEQAPDVVLLSEIDRGWLLNGGQDQLRLLATLLEMEASFGPAADPVWGDAILTRLPVGDVASQPLRDFGAPTGAQVLMATVVKDGVPFEIVSTHLQPSGSGPDDGALDQARQIAGLVAARRVEGRGLVLGGDLNIEPGSESFRALLAVGLTDGLAASRPVPTSPADRPAEEIDHLLVTSELVVAEARSVRTELSDHLPVVVTLTPISR